MKDTIKAKYGYTVTKVINIITGKTAYMIRDGSKGLFVAQKVNEEDYKEEKEQNEAYYFCEKFTTIEGDQFIYWRDNELNEDYITKITSKNKKGK